MRLLGKCPNCRVEDSIVVKSVGKDFHKVTLCENCNQQWPDWIRLSSEEERKGNKLIPIEVWRIGRQVQLEWTSIYQVSWGRLVATVVNTALMVRFKLDVCLATEGGVQGKYRKEPIELRNCDREIGLYDEYDLKDGKGAEEILNWYEALLRILFEEPMMVGDKNVGRGAILKLSNAPENENEAKKFLWVALYKKTKSKGFANSVFQRLEAEKRNPFSSRYIAGLSDEDIAELFVPPPIAVIPAEK